ncbi:MAG: hypothetical protein R2797_13855 [Gelidibacter sp.]
MKTKNLFLATTLFTCGAIFIMNSQNNTFTGSGAGNGNTGGSNSGFGVDVLSNNNSGNSNVAFGVEALQNNVSGNQNIGIGWRALSGANTGNYNIAIGGRNLDSNIGGTGNISLGWRTLEENISGSSNVGIGYYCLPNSNGSGNIALGYFTALNLTSGNNNVIIGKNLNVENAATTSTLAGFDISNSVIIGTNAIQRLFIRDNGYTGIGLGNNVLPQNRLEIASGVSGTAGLRFRGINVNSPSIGTNGRVLTVNANGDVVLATDQGSGGSTIIVDGTNTTVTGTGVTATPYQINAQNIYTDDGTLTTTSGLRTITMGNNNLFFNTNGSNFADGTQGSGRIYIGNTLDLPNLDSTGATTGSISQYRLLVEGGILTEKVKVAVAHSVNWADYVFEKDYKLMPLTEVERFINENNHLPGIESADELVKNGLDLGDMQAKQMAKIEELTFYIIEQNKTLEKQNLEIVELKEQVKLLLEKR